MFNILFSAVEAGLVSARGCVAGWLGYRKRKEGGGYHKEIHKIYPSSFMQPIVLTLFQAALLQLRTLWLHKPRSNLVSNPLGPT